MNTIGSHTSLGDLVSWNTPAASSASTTTARDAQNTLNQTPATILSSLEPTGQSLYGAAPEVDSLLSNISTSASLNALQQINGSRDSASQISPFSSASDAVSYVQDSEADSNATVVASALSGLNDSSSLGLLSAYYSNTASTSTFTGPSVNVTG
jgi:hypothetical protein